MRLANLNGRAVLVASDDTGVDVGRASKGRFGPELTSIYDRWTEFCSWADGQPVPPSSAPIDRTLLGPPSPTPRQVFGIGLNYGDHAAESGLAVPEGLPPVFTKFPTCLTGPDTTVELPNGGHTDWEVELVLVIGRRAHRIGEADAWDHIAGVSAGQDLSERIAQLAGPAPQFSFGKSYPGFGPTGPWITTPDELPDRDNLEIGCRIDGEIVQHGQTKDMIMSVAPLVSRLSQGVELLPGDLIFTGTPAGVGLGMKPQRFLQPGEVLESWVEGVGSLHQTFVVERGRP